MLPAATKLGQGNVFTGVCDSVHMGGLQQGEPPSRETPRQGEPPGKETPRQGEPPWQGDPPGRETPRQGESPRQGDPPAYGQ